MNRILLISLMILMNSAFAAMIKGFVTDVNDKPMPEANVTIVGSTKGAATDEKGYFFIKNIDSGKYTIKCTFVGYKDDILRNVKVYKDSVSSVDFYMIPLEMKLDEVEVEKLKDKLRAKVYHRDLGHSVVVKEIKVPDNKNDSTDIELQIGFWEKFKYYIWKIFN